MSDKGVKVVDWTQVPSKTVQEIQQLSSGRTGKTKTSRLSRTVNEYLNHVRKQDLYGHGHPVLEYDLLSTASSTARRIRYLNTPARYLKPNNIIKGVVLHNGEAIYAAHIEEKGTWYIWITLFNSDEEAKAAGLDLDEYRKARTKEVTG